MQELFSSGLVVDIILALMLAEGVVLTLLYRAKGIGVEPLKLWINLAAGAALFLALRSALTGGDWQITALFLAVGLVTHFADLAARWQR